MDALLDDVWVLQRLLAPSLDLSLAEPAKLLGQITPQGVAVQPWAHEVGFETEGLERLAVLLRPFLQPQANAIALDLGWRRAATWLDNAGRFGILEAPQYQGGASMSLQEHHVQRMETTAASVFRLGQLARSYPLVILEDLNHTAWSQDAHAAVDFAGWRVIRPYLSLDSLYRNYRLRVIPAFNSSTRCPECGAFNPRMVPRKTYNCSGCGLVLDVDLLAAANLLLRHLSPQQHAA